LHDEYRSQLTPSCRNFCFKFDQLYRRLLARQPKILQKIIDLHGLENQEFHETYSKVPDNQKRKMMKEFWPSLDVFLELPDPELILQDLEELYRGTLNFPVNS